MGPGRVQFAVFTRLPLGVKLCFLLPVGARKLRLVERLLQLIRPPPQRGTAIQTRRDRT